MNLSKIWEGTKARALALFGRAQGGMSRFNRQVRLWIDALGTKRTWMSAARALATEFAHLDPKTGASLRAALAKHQARYQRDRRREAVDALLLRHLYRHIHALPKNERPTALCLSGGGIRSATFCLGALQALAQGKRLDRFRYLSTVSGGGYIGCCLTAWISEKHGRLAEVVAGLGSATRGGRQPGATVESDPVSRLRAYSNYLSPVVGVSGDSMSLVATFLRNLVLNLAVWLPLIACLVLIPRLYVAASAHRVDEAWGTALAAAAFGCIVAGIAYMASDLPAAEPRAAVKDRFALQCFAPVLAASILMSLIGAWLSAQYSGVAWLYPAFGVAANLVGTLAGQWLRALRGNGPRPVQRLLPSALLFIGASAGGGYLLGVFLGHLGSQDAGLRSDPLAYATLAVPLMLIGFWLAITFHAGLMRRFTSEEDREWWSRASGWWLLTAMAWVIFFGLVNQAAPLVLQFVQDQEPKYLSPGAQVGASGVVLGALTSLAGYWSKNGAKVTKHAKGIAAALGSQLLAALSTLALLLILLGASIAMSRAAQWCPFSNAESPRAVAWLCQTEPPAAAGTTPRPSTTAVPVPTAREEMQYRDGLKQSQFRAVAIWILALGALAYLMASATGANTFSLHGMYANRLVRAYLGAVRSRRQPHWFSGFDIADNRPLSEARAGAVDSAGRRVLFPVINMAINLVKPSAERLAWQQRKAASFTATPLFCGSDTTGHVDTEQYGDPAKGGMTIGRAMAISGAAASPNMGYHSSPPVTLIMSLFNVRLGWWMTNPKELLRNRLANSEPRLPLKAMVDEAFGRTTHDRSSVYLSDGGHFDNLGVYEMVRRRCWRILLVDATCDPKFQYADLHDTVRKIRIDLGVRIELPAVLPGQPRAPASWRLCVGRIRYSDCDGTDAEDDGYFYLLKPLLAGNEPPDIGHYAHAQRRGGPFPHQTTADPFFDEAQFESYRMLGLHSIQQALPGPFGKWPVENPQPLALTHTAAAPTRNRRSPAGAREARGPRSGPGNSRHLGWGGRHRGHRCPEGRRDGGLEGWGNDRVEGRVADWPQRRATGPSGWHSDDDGCRRSQDEGAGPGRDGARHGEHERRNRFNASGRPKAAVQIDLAGKPTYYRPEYFHQA